jgi:hypothetical protein
MCICKILFTEIRIYVKDNLSKNKFKHLRKIQFAILRNCVK